MPAPEPTTIGVASMTTPSTPPPRNELIAGWNVEGTPKGIPEMGIGPIVSEVVTVRGQLDPVKLKASAPFADPASVKSAVG